jgi:hypothetical protein
MEQQIWSSASSQLVFILLTRSMETAQPDSTPDFASCGQYNKLTKEQQHFCTKLEWQTCHQLTAIGFTRNPKRKSSTKRKCKPKSFVTSFLVSLITQQLVET